METRTGDSRLFMRGVISALTGATLWGLSGACIQLLASEYHTPSLFISCVRATVAGVLFLTFTLVTRRESVLSLIGSGRARGTLVLFGVGIYLSQITYAISVAATNAGTATVLQSLCTLFVMIVTCIQLRRLPQWKDFLGLICAVAAASLIATQGDFGVLAIPLVGLAWGLAAALAETLYIVTPQKLYLHWDRMTIIGCGMAIAGVTALVAWLAFVVAGAAPEVPPLDARGMIVLVGGVGVLGTFASFGLFLWGVSVVGSVKGSLLGVAEPVGAMVISTVWLGTVFTGADWAGLVLMTIMIVLVSTSGKSKEASAS